MKSIIFSLLIASFVFAQSEQSKQNDTLNYQDTLNYVIITDDNLWTLSERYYNNPFEWRYIWEHNPYISNPNLIYPGDRILIPQMRNFVVSSETVKLHDTTKTLTQITEQTKKIPTKSQVSLVEKFKYYFSLEAQRQSPFLYESIKERTDDILSFGEVVGDGRMVIAQYQNASVKINEDKIESIKTGDRFDFYKLGNSVSRKDYKGVVVEPVATGIIKKFYSENNQATVFIDKVWGVLSVGARVFPVGEYKSLGEELGYTVLGDSVKVQVISRINTDVSVKIGEILFVDKGEDDEIMLGDHFVFYENGKRMSANELIAEGLVVATEDRTSTIRITTARELSVLNTFVGVRDGRIVAK